MNKMMRNLDVLSFLLALLLLSGCTKETAYEQYKATVAKELASGSRADSLFFGVHLGMSSKEFYGHCWEMNKKGLFTDGENNAAVLYKLNNGELGEPVSMNFYPTFFEDKIIKMRVAYQYDAWAPWNKNLFADSLQLRVVELYKQWYSEGNPFIKMDDPERGTIYVKVDGNRRIIIGKFNDSRVKVDFTDLKVEEEILKEHGKE